LLNYKAWLHKEHNYVHNVFIKWSLNKNHDMLWNKDTPYSHLSVLENTSWNITWPSHCHSIQSYFKHQFRHLSQDCILTEKHPGTYDM
jgi:hypothetical protein